MQTVTTNGTGTAAAMNDGRPIIAKTGTTNTAQSAFFIGAIPQYALSVGIFTENQSTKTTETLNGLGGSAGGGFGGYWPARIWNTFAEAEFAQLPQEPFLSTVFTGAKWNQVGNLPTQKKPVKQKQQPKDKKHSTPPGQGQGNGNGNGHHHHGGGGGPSQSPSPNPSVTLPTGLPTSTGSPTATPTTRRTPSGGAPSGGTPSG
jgi:membrane peptidoglycan carboxypeptidase